MRKKKVMGKKGQLLTRYLVAFLAIGIIVTGFITIPAQQDGFYDKYEYIQQNNTIEELDQTDEYSQTVKDVVCDINKEAEGCDEKPSVQSQSGSIIQNIFAGGYSIIITMVKSLGTTENLLFEFSKLIGIPPIFINILVSMLIGLIGITLFLIIFNRSQDV